MTRHFAVPATAAVVLVLTLAACGSGSGAGAPGPSAGVTSGSATTRSGMMTSGSTGPGVGSRMMTSGSTGPGVGSGVMTSGSTGPGAGSGMMNGGGSGMMNGDSQYHYSQLGCSAPAALPGRTVKVIVADMGMTRMMGGIAPMGSHMMLRATPTTVPAGPVSLVVSNLGWRTHELVILPLATGVAAGHRTVGSDGKVSEAGSLGEASGSCAAGTGEGIAAGKVGWVTVTLAPGRYELLCNLQNHYTNGMYEEFTVS